MEPRARTRLNLLRAGLLAALTALLVPAVAGTATADAAKRKKKRSPVITSVAPANASVGDTLTIRGRDFRAGREKNTVLFKRDRGKAVFVKARIGTRKLLKVTLPEKLEDQMLVQDGTRVETRFRLRVLSKRLGRKFSSGKRRPFIGPEKPPAPPVPPESGADGDCDGDKVVNRLDADDDNDLLADTVELPLKLDPCKADSDGDGVTDGYEHASARDLNDGEHQNPNEFLPYPGKRPYPNALDASDAHTDHDGDSLTLAEEFALWQYVGIQSLDRMSYSAGEQYSASTRDAGTGRRTPTLQADGYHKQADFLAWAVSRGYASVALADVGTTFGSTSADWWAGRTVYDIRDMDRSGDVTLTESRYYSSGAQFLDDAQRDEDADGLSNWAETRGCMSRGHWDSLYDKETPYPLTYSGTLLSDGDTDGDGIRDGADDQDNDDVPNIMECSRQLAYGNGAHGPLPARAAVNPFNACMPHDRSRTCKRYVTIGDEWAPFNPDDTYYLIKN